jgi:hypothetical protein
MMEVSARLSELAIFVEKIALIKLERTPEYSTQLSSQTILPESYIQASSQFRM